MAGRVRGLAWVGVAGVVLCVGCVGPDVNFEGTGHQRTTGAATVCVHEFEDLRPAFEHDCGFAGPGVYPTDDSRFDQPVPKIVADAVAERLARAGFRVVRDGPADYDMTGKLLHYQIIENLNLLTMLTHPAILLTQRDWFNSHVEYQVELTRRSDRASLMRRSFSVHHKKHVPVGLLYLNRVERGWGYVMRRLEQYGWFVAGALSDRVVAEVDPGQVDLAALDRPASRIHPLFDSEVTVFASAPRIRAPEARQVRVASAAQPRAPMAWQVRPAPRTVRTGSAGLAGPVVRMDRAMGTRKVQTVRETSSVAAVAPAPAPTVQVVTRPAPPIPTAQVQARRPPVVLSAADPRLLRPPSRFKPSTEWEPL